ncbi:putative extracellular protein, gamma-D-glutamate-meso-diaminopimelate muropeptidase (putative) [Enhygromyxa salina]|uniref:Putative extracellular protein, gamma-D-glutamate-meso-diaminopimelate muropeptidase (Putative) n=1 Tax=Enhygromyxa salina TaxID=215803 RepID=A0A0C2CV46_9BACT|nr:putative extracellular protein, gamma-D-glutamate-meso-diaminopimelate muropeptidase (putative) [Enhygromyxa salina]
MRGSSCSTASSASRERPICSSARTPSRPSAGLGVPVAAIAVSSPSARSAWPRRISSRSARSRSRGPTRSAPPRSSQSTKSLGKSLGSSLGRSPATALAGPLAAALTGSLAAALASSLAAAPASSLATAPGSSRAGSPDAPPARCSRASTQPSIASASSASSASASGMVPPAPRTCASVASASAATASPSPTRAAATALASGSPRATKLAGSSAGRPQRRSSTRRAICGSRRGSLSEAISACSIAARSGASPPERATASIARTTFAGHPPVASCSARAQRSSSSWLENCCSTTPSRQRRTCATVHGSTRTSAIAGSSALAPTSSCPSSGSTGSSTASRPSPTPARRTAACSSVDEAIVVGHVGAWFNPQARRVAPGPPAPTQASTQPPASSASRPRSRPSSGPSSRASMWASVSWAVMPSSGSRARASCSNPISSSITRARPLPGGPSTATSFTPPRSIACAAATSGARSPRKDQRFGSHHAGWARSSSPVELARCSWRSRATSSSGSETRAPGEGSNKRSSSEASGPGRSTSAASASDRIRRRTPSTPATASSRSGLRHGTCPNRRRHKRLPTPKRSAAGPPSPASTSGAKNPGVPHPWLPSWPRSVSTTPRVGVTITLLALTSPWWVPSPWIAASASATPSASTSACSIGTGPGASTSPSTNCVTSQIPPVCGSSMSSRAAGRCGEDTARSTSKARATVPRLSALTCLRTTGRPPASLAIHVPPSAPAPSRRTFANLVDRLPLRLSLAGDIRRKVGHHRRRSIRTGHARLTNAGRDSGLPAKRGQSTRP